MANVLGTLFSDIASAIREKSGESGTMKPAEFPDKIAAIPTGGGSVEGVATITFYNYNGAKLYSRQVFIGDDCPDPITQNKIETPTRESTAQYDYAYNGWSLTEGSTANADALKSITADRAVYAAYTRAVRYYTISFYDGDTLLKSEQYAYGTTPNYEPLKDEYTFVGWEPALVAVICDASYFAQWTELITFKTASWAQIAQISESGEAPTKFAIGDTKTFTMTVNNKTETVQVEIAGFGMDNLSDGTGTAGITLFSTHVHSYASDDIGTHTRMTKYPGYAWKTSYLRDYLATKVYNGLPSDLRSVIKQVSKKSQITGTPTYEYVDDTCWIPSFAELGLNAPNNLVEAGTTAYPIFTDDASRTYSLYGKTSKYSYATRNSTGAGPIANSDLGHVNDAGQTGGYRAGAYQQTLLCFCI